MVKEVVNLRWVHFSVKGMLGENVRKLLHLMCYVVSSKNTYIFRPVVPGCAGCAMAHPDFGRSVNPISTRGDRLCPPNYYWHTRIFRPSKSPGKCCDILENVFSDVLLLHAKNHSP